MSPLSNLEPEAAGPVDVAVAVEAVVVAAVAEDAAVVAGVVFEAVVAGTGASVELELE